MNTHVEYINQVEKDKPSNRKMGWRPKMHFTKEDFEKTNDLMKIWCFSLVREA